MTEVAVDPVADEGLLAVDDDRVALFNGRRLDRRQVAPRIRLRHGDRRDDVAGDAAGQVFLLLFLRGEGDDIGDDDVAVEGCREARMIGPAQLLRHDDGVEEIGAEAAVFLGHVHGKETLLAHPLPGAPGDNARLLPLLDMGDDFLFQILPQGIPEDPVFL